MQRRTLIAAVGAIMGTGLGAAAYTSATVDRAATINVNTDQNGLIQLTPSADFSQITEDGTTGALTIDFQNLNVDSTFTFGDAAAPDTTHAFSLVQNDSDRDVTFEYALDTDPDGTTPNVTFDIYSWDSTNSVAVSEGTATEASGATFTATAGTSYYVVLTFDTTGMAQADSLSGTLTIST